jgi:hypothetical protein
LLAVVFLAAVASRQLSCSLPSPELASELTL